MRKKTLVEWCNQNNRHDILSEWDYSKNDSINDTPETIASRSTKKVWWNCSVCNNSWKSAVNNRVNGCGCPKCGHKACDSKRRIASFENSLASRNPDLLDEWDYENNQDINPASVHFGSELKVRWICKKCGNRWEARINNRAHGKGCPFCANIEINSGVNDLESLFPEIASEYDISRNTIPASKIFSKSNKKVWWKCDKGHSYYSSVASRTSSQNGCPYCSGRMAITGSNDLKTIYPDIAKEWDFEKNKNILPETTLPSSGKKIWWKCDKGHSWQAPPYSRIKGVGCPTCNGLFQTSLPEQAIRYYLAPHFSTISRAKIHGVEIDVFLPDLNIGIEYDGMFFHSSDRARQKEEKKNKILEEEGIKLIRVKENLEKDAIEGYTIFYKFKPNYEGLDCTIRLLVSLIQRITKTDFPVSIDFKRDRLVILSQFKQQSINNSFPIERTFLLDEWDYDKNGEINPYSFSPHSNQKVWWKCSNEHSFIASIDNRVSGKGCPVCNNKLLLTGYNDLQSRFPLLAEEWDNSKNDDTPDRVIITSSAKKWWKCSTCEFEWMTSVRARVKGSGCPRCSKIVAAKKQEIPRADEDTLAQKYPEIAAQWDFNKNGSITPEHVFPYSNKKRWWICPKGHSYEMQVVKRTQRGYNCPYCSGQSILSGYNDLATLCPDIIHEWDYEKNSIAPEQVALASNRKAWWICPECGNSYLTRIYDRTKKDGTGCPICGRKKANNNRKKAVRNIETGEVFDGIIDAAKKYNKSTATLSACLLGKCHTAYGYHWEYYHKNTI